MLPPSVQPCPHCRADLQRRGLRLFLHLPCPGCGARVRAREKIDRYQLREPLAGSGLGMIVRAFDSQSGVEVALKLYHPPRSSVPRDVEQFIAITQKVIELDHPHIVRVFAAGCEAGVPFVAREWLAAGSLTERLAAGRRAPETEVLAIGLQVASAMAAAEAVGVWHRDLEPGNLIFADASTIKVADFGQAVFFDAASVQAGTVWGTLPYVAPERLRNEPEDARSDIYALGATLYHALTGEAPHGGEAQGEPLVERLLSGALHIDRAKLPVRPATANLLEQMLALDPSARPQNWAEVEELIQQAEPRVPRPIAPPRASLPVAASAPVARLPKRRAWVAPLLLSLAVLIAAGVAWQKRPRPLIADVAEPEAGIEEAPLEVEVAPAPSVNASTPPPPAAPLKAEVAPALPPPTAASAIPQPPAAFDYHGWTTIKLDPAPNKDSVAGEATVLPAGAIRMAGSNDGVGGRRDAVVFHQRQLGGDWTLVARVASVSGGVAGLMVRHDLELSRWCLAVTLGEDGNGVTKTRPEPDAPAVASAPLPGANWRWLKLTRRGALFEAHRSENGTTWQPAGSLTPPSPPANVPAGFITHALTKQGAASATFDQVSLQTPP